VDAIANWIWQGSTVAILAGATCATSRRMSATARCRVWWIALAIVLLLPLAPALGGWREGGLGLGAPAAALASEPDPASAVSLPGPPWWMVAILGSIWTIWFGGSVARISSALAMLRLAKRAVRPFPEDHEARFTNWRTLRAHERRRTRLVLSDHVRLAAVLGLGSPVVAVSPGLVSKLTDAELDRILVHEWAHVQRRDDYGRLLQLIINALAGLHPAVWWIDKQIHAEREAACDDWALNLVGSPRSYAACLTKLASLAPESPDVALLPAAVSGSKFTRRVTRLLDVNRITSTKKPLITTALVGAFILSMGVFLSDIRLIGFVTPPSGLASTPASAAASPESPPALAPRALPARTGVDRVDGDARQPEPVGVRRRADRRPVVAADRTTQTTGALAGELQPAHQPPPVEVHGAIFEMPVSFMPTSASLATETIATLETADRQTLPDPAKPATPWGAAADAGESIGRGSQKAGVATAGFFTRLSKSVAGSFR
jgi:beta-lactamase regulating signal transducer with metallopeptidase domain